MLDNLNINNNFIHLRVHSNFSLAEGMLSFNDLSNFCNINMQPAIAITDTSNMFGVLEFSLEMISKGVQPIIGIQVNICDSINEESPLGEVVLIAKNKLGYKNLLKISSNLSTNSNFDKFVAHENLFRYCDGLIILTGGVEKGFIGKPASFGNEELVDDRLNLLTNYFQDNLYIELQRHGIDSEEIAEPILLKAATDLNLPIVATNDCYFISPDKFESHQILSCIDRGHTLSSIK